ncbi:hypothetical protein ACFV4P_07400 [Kitasatospora sp. NPDC059795]|uniref:hypothetical protein n=1 Tax=Kitasatospora sp. NPDC059795 TaxID=3346949 RepID=UPI003649A979
MASTTGDGPAAADLEETFTLPTQPPGPQQGARPGSEQPPANDPFATSVNLRVNPTPPDLTPGGNRTAPPTPTPAGGTPVPPPPTAPPAAVTTGWTGMIPVITADTPPPGAPAPAPAQAPAPAHAPASAPSPAPTPAQARGIGRGLRGRILVVEGGYGGGRRWGRGGAGHASVLSAALAGVAPQILLSADQVDAVHLPGANDPQTVLAHLRAAARHPGPLLIHLGGHLVTDRRGDQMYLSLRENKASESLPWTALATELRHRGTEFDTLVIGDLSADPVLWPHLVAAAAGQQLSEGVPLWAVVNHDPDQLGTFTRALIETLHRGRPGADQLLTPELVRQQVHSVLRPDTVVITAHPGDRPWFRNTARQVAPADPAAGRPAAPPVPPNTPPAAPTSRPAEPARPRLAPGWTPRVLVSLRKAGVPATPARRRMIVSLERGVPMVPVDTQLVDLGKATGAPAAPVATAAPVAPVVPEPAAPAANAGPAAPVASEPAVAAVAAVAAVPVASEPAVRLGKDLPDPAAPRVELAKSGPESVDPRVVTFFKGDAVPTVSEPDAALPWFDPLAATVPLSGSAQAAALPLPDPGATAPTVPLDKPQPAVQHDPLASTVPLDKPRPAVQHDPAAATVPLEQKAAPVPAAAPATPATPATPVAAAEQAPPTDYLAAIGPIVQAAEAGDHDTAAALALALEERAVAAHGQLAPAVLQVRQVRAHVSRVAGLPVLAAELYRQVANALLQTEGPEHPETQRAATNAEACWRAVKDPAEAIRIAPEIIELRAHLPGPDSRKLRASERYLQQLVNAKAAAMR